MENNIIISINFGANNSKVGIFKDGKVQLVPNSVGDILTPSIVEILNKSEKVGEEIIRYNINESNLFSNLNKLFDKLISDLDDYEEKDYSICIKKNGKDIFYKPEEIISFIFKKLIKNASDFMGETITKAILTVPFYFNEFQIALMMKCAVTSNIKVVKFLKEPIAAAMAYGFGIENISNEPQFSIMKKDNTSDKFLFVFDFGGAKLDMSILRANDLVILIVNNLVDTNFGGNDFDNKLIDLCIKDFCTKININENEIRKDFNALRRLKIHCKKAKEKLSKYNSTNITIYHFFKEFDLNLEINIEKFNEECKDLFNKIEKKLDKILLDSKFSNDNIDDVILVGGSTKIKKVQELLEKKFSKNKIMNKLNYDEVIAIGATLEARNIMIKKKMF